MLKVIIFDMDGVLIDSSKYVWESFEKTFEEDVSFSKKDVKKYLGRSLKDQLKSIKKDFQTKDYNIKEFSKKAGETQFELMEDKLKPDKKLLSLIDTAKKKGIKVAVATSSLRWRAKKILTFLKIIERLDMLVTADDVENHKPAPDIFLKTAEKLKVNPENCVVIEDAANGIEAAKKAGMKAIGLTTKFYPASHLREADLIINNLSEITLGKLESLFKMFK